MTHESVGVVVGRDELSVRAVRGWAEAHAGVVTAKYCVHLLCGAMMLVPVLSRPGLTLGVGPLFGFGIARVGAGLFIVVVIFVGKENCGQVGC